MEEPEIAVVGTKGQFVIPQDLRRRLAIKPKTRLAIYRKGDKLVVTKLKVPTAGEELDDFFAEIDERSKKVASDQEIIKEIQAYRKEKNHGDQVTRVVIDTNVLVSATIGHGKPRLLLRLVLKEHSAVASREMLAELADVLIRNKFSLRPGQVDRFLTIYVRKCEVIDLGRRVNAVDADPDDNIVLDTAVNGGAALIVTGDKHLLALEGFEGIRIVTVAAALKILTADKSK